MHKRIVHYYRGLSRATSHKIKSTLLIFKEKYAKNTTKIYSKS